MPICEYKCKECDSYFEKRQSVNDPPLRNCEKCSGELEKLISLSGFAFKGDGWYVTDYAGKNGTKTAQNGEKSDKPADSGSTTAAETASKVKNVASVND